MSRYTVKETPNGTCSIYDTERGCTILKSVTPNATYNKAVAGEVVKALHIVEELDCGGQLKAEEADIVELENAFGQCPECLDAVSNDELEMFGGLCEECSGAFDE